MQGAGFVVYGEESRVSGHGRKDTWCSKNSSHAPSSGDFNVLSKSLSLVLGFGVWVSATL